MINSLPHKSQMLLFSQIMGGFLKTIGKHHDGIGTLLREFKSLRKEYINLLKDDVMVGLLQAKGEGAFADNLSRERLAILLQKLVASFRADQEKSYQFIEQGLWKEILENISKQSLEEGMRELSNLREEMQQALNERDGLLEDRKNLRESLQKFQTELKKTQQERDHLQQQVTTLSSELKELKTAKKVAEDNRKDTRLAMTDFEAIIRDVRKSLEGKNEYDLWRLKVFYNKVAALTNSTWSYPGVPKPDPYDPESRHVRKFLESL